MEAIADQRFLYFGYIEGWRVESSGDWCLDWPFSQQVKSEESSTDDKLRGLHYEICRNNDDATKIHEAIEKGRSILASDPDKDWYNLDLFGNILFEAFNRTEKIEPQGEHG
jgi:hypothetical protein